MQSRMPFTAITRHVWPFLLLLLLLPVIFCQFGERKPNVRDWQDDKDRLVNWLLTGCIEPGETNCPDQGEMHSEYESYDGWYNNKARPDQGAVDTPLMRMLPPAYHDGVYQPVSRSANPFTVSSRLMQGRNGNVSASGKTAFLVYFGQQVVEEVLDAQRPGCPPEYMFVDIPEDHEYRTRDPKLSIMPLLRSRYDMNTGFSPNNPRQQLNEITPYLDGGLFYGTGKGWADVLRTFSNGTLAPHGLLAWHDTMGRNFPAANNIRLPMANPPAPSNHSQYLDQQFTAPVDRFFKLGNPRGNENPFLLTFGIFFFRWHNKLATKLHELHPTWSDERVFNEARKWVIATHQSLVMYDWLPKWLHKSVDDYKGYKPAVDPQISHAFQSAAMRFGHTLVTSGVYLRHTAKDGCGTVAYSLNPHRQEGADHSAGVRTCNSFWRSPEIFWKESKNIERFLMGMSSQSTEREDHIIVDDLRSRVFGPLEFSRRDLMAINLQRGRDHGLPDYNTARKHMGLPMLDSLDPDHFRGVTGSLVDREVLAQLSEVYGTPNNMDIWAGGLMETTLGPGQLFSKIIKDQFERIRDGDRFWFENTNNDQFRSHERDRIRNIKIIDLLLSVTDITPDDIQEDPFTAVHSNNPLPMCQGVLTEVTDCHLLGIVNPTNSTIKCRYLPPLGDSILESCTTPMTFDYFTGSAVSFILTFLVVAIITVGLLMTIWMLSYLSQVNKAKKSSTSINISDTDIVAKERVSATESRFVAVTFQTAFRRITVQSLSGSLLRIVDLQNLADIAIRHLSDNRHIVLRVKHHYDLYLKFSDAAQGHKMMSVIEKFCKDCDIIPDYKLESGFKIRMGVATYKKRAQELAEFSRLVLETLQEEIDKPDGGVVSIMDMMPSDKTHLFSMQITRAELAGELGTDPDTLFMKQLFRQMDKDQNGFILLKEFWDVMTTFARGSLKDKAQLIFNIYDVSGAGSLSESDLKDIIGSMIGSEGREEEIEAVITSIFASSDLQRGQNINFEIFFKQFGGDNTVLDKVNFQAGRAQRNRHGHWSIYGNTVMEEEKDDKDKVEVFLNTHDNKEIKKTNETNSGSRILGLIRDLHNNQVFYWWGMTYTFVMFLIFAERAYFYSVERESSGLRRIAGYGVTVTRGAASAMMFTYSSLLVTMCRNLFNVIRASFLHRYFPIDHMISLHRYIGGWALVWTIAHVVGHAINFYHIATQTPSDLSCLFRDFFRQTNVLPKFHYWCWETITGFTGVLLTLQCAVIYVFAYFARQYYFRLFWLTHNTYPLFYILIVLHGSGNLVQAPFFHFFFLGPAVLFVLDKLVSISANTVRINVLEAHHLPSHVTLLKIRRPLNFSFQAGQWIRIASTAISKQEYHPFTISSAPHEEHLTLHIRAVGPWTTRLRKEYHDLKALPEGSRYPMIYIDGPFGEGHQTWWDYEVSILVGGGIGVTPFASILKHIAHCCQESTFNPKTKRVMFLWVTNSQKQFEWLTKILHEVEDKDTRGIIRNHIFITQYKNKFDLRTVFLYLAERHFQNVSGTSLFTGLKAVTHFSRPPFLEIFRAVKKQYKFASKVGVFTCGSNALSESVEQSCREVNEDNDDVIYKHYYENF